MKAASSLKRRLAGWYALAVGVVLLTYAAAVYLLVARSMSRDLDGLVHDDYEAAETMLEETSDGIVRWRPGPAHDETYTDRWVEVHDSGGRLIHRHGAALPGASVRIYQAEHRVGGQVVTIRAARSEDRMRGELALLSWVLGLGLPIGVGLAVLGGYLIAGAALAPLSRMASRAREISAERLHERLPVGEPANELGQLAIAFNEAFSRLETSFDQLRRFTADASHELRTPLTALRSVGEIGMQEATTVEALREVIGSMLEEARRLTDLVATLLELARAEGGKVPLERRPVDLVTLAAQVSAELEVLAEERSQRIQVEGASGIDTPLDAGLLRHALVNLIDNAIKYSAEASLIRVVVEHGETDASVSVCDQGPGIDIADRGRVFDRFFRADAARTGQGFGLGLTIARLAVEAHGGRITLDSELGVGSTFRIVLPRA